MFLIVTFACTQGVSDKDSATAATPPAPVTCAPAGADAVTWSAGAPVSARDHHATWVHPDGAGRLLVLGGYAADGDAGDYLDDVWSISLGDPTSAVWEPGPALPLTLAAPVVVEAEGRVWLTGGKRSNLAGSTNTVLSAALDAGGVPTTWDDETPLTVARWHHAALVVGSRLYVVGGQVENNVATPDVVMAELEGGTLSEWVTMTPLPAATSHAAVVELGGALYVLGGLQDARFTDTIWRSELGTDGALGPWEEAGTLPGALATHAAVVVGDDLWVLGGVLANGDLPTTVFRASPGSDGALEDWEEIGEPLPGGVSHVHQIPCWNGHLYAVGGKSSEGASLTELRVGTLVEG